MPGHGCPGQRCRRAHRAAAMLVGIAALVGVGAPAAAAGTTAPLLTLTSTRTRDVHITWRFGTDRPRRDLVLQIDRGPDAAHLTRRFDVARPRPRAFRLDRAPLPGTNVYRARVVVGGAPTPWSATAAIDSAGGPALPPSLGCDPAAVIRLVNDVRAGVPVAPLAENALLRRAARVHTDTMVARHALTHDGWIAEIRDAGYSGSALGQNIADGYQSATAVMAAWMASPGHRANILNPDFDDVGVGCAADRGGRLFWTEDFGGP